MSAYTSAALGVTAYVIDLMSDAPRVRVLRGYRRSCSICYARDVTRACVCSHGAVAALLSYALRVYAQRVPIALAARCAGRVRAKMPQRFCYAHAMFTFTLVAAIATSYVISATLHYAPPAEIYFRAFCARAIDAATALRRATR